MAEEKFSPSEDSRDEKIRQVMKYYRKELKARRLEQFGQYWKIIKKENNLLVFERRMQGLQDDIMNVFRFGRKDKLRRLTFELNPRGNDATAVIESEKNSDRRQVKLTTWIDVRFKDDSVLIIKNVEEKVTRRNWFEDRNTVKKDIAEGIAYIEFVEKITLRG